MTVRTSAITPVAMARARSAPRSSVASSALLVGTQLEVALAHWREHVDHRVPHRLLEGAVALAGELGLHLLRPHPARDRHHLDQVGYPLLAGAAHDLAAGVGLGPLDLAPDGVGLVVDVDEPVLAAVGGGHLRPRVLQVHDPGADGGDHVLGLGQHLGVGRVETACDLAGQLYVLALVVAHRHLVGAVEQDVRSLEHGVEEETGPHQLLLAGRLVLELGHALQVAVRGDRRQEPAELRVLGHVGLAKEDAALGVEPGGDQHGCGVKHVAGESLGVVGHARGVQVDDAVDRGVAALLAVEVAADGADVVAQMLAAGGLDAAEDAHAGAQSRVRRGPR